MNRERRFESDLKKKIAGFGFKEANVGVEQRKKRCGS